VPLILKKTQKGLPQFVTNHLPVTILILEGASFNVNQAVRERLVMSFRGVQMNLGGEESQIFFASLKVTYQT
jgi:hypothetical protein